ncbi:hypothetical protein OG601_10985 [Streptomyces sp. NBC_01239]|uniref:hypothetical protein n=1 Tax=Streptomyces sp. NBC_01239 TaxID=2903792 RepID=UPI00225853BD|nr:hypothetical protein [Streptomyces sp. NBC_01239]MCX4811146.1 hypothetical protein [Streptomyces sp. NBC_01239]
MTEARARPGIELSPGALTAAGVGSLALGTVASWSDLLLVVGGRVVPGWGVSAVLFALALVLWRIFVRARRRGEAVLLSVVRPGWLRPATVLLIVAAVSGIAWGALDDLISDARYYVLRPTGPGGCTAVVRETSFLVIGNGEAYAVGRTGLALGEAGSWVVDDGYRPVAAGTYKLDWERDGGLLVVSGSGTDPVVRGGMTDIDCGW